MAEWKTRLKSRFSGKKPREYLYSVISLVKQAKRTP